jgi:hypothetical protein
VDAQRRFAESSNEYHLALCDHQIALKNVNYEKGTLLEYNNIMTVDGLASAPTTPKPKVNLDVLEQAAAASKALRMKAENEARLESEETGKQADPDAESDADA